MIAHVAVCSLIGCWSLSTGLDSLTQSPTRKRRSSSTTKESAAIIVTQAAGADCTPLGVFVQTSEIHDGNHDCFMANQKVLICVQFISTKSHTAALSCCPISLFLTRLVLELKVRKGIKKICSSFFLTLRNYLLTATTQLAAISWKQ